MDCFDPENQDEVCDEDHLFSLRQVYARELRQSDERSQVGQSGGSAEEGVGDEVFESVHELGYWKSPRRRRPTS